MRFSFNKMREILPGVPQPEKIQVSTYNAVNNLHNLYRCLNVLKDIP